MPFSPWVQRLKKEWDKDSSLSSSCGLSFTQVCFMLADFTLHDKQLPDQCWMERGEIQLSWAKCDVVGLICGSSPLAQGPLCPKGLTVVHRWIGMCSVAEELGDEWYGWCVVADGYISGPLLEMCPLVTIIVLFRWVLWYWWFSGMKDIWPVRTMFQ